MPISRHVAMMRTAISPRLAINIFLNIVRYLTSLERLNTGSLSVVCFATTSIQLGLSAVAPSYYKHSYPDKYERMVKGSAFLLNSPYAIPGMINLGLCRPPGAE